MRAVDIEPIGPRVLVRPSDPVSQTQKGIILPDKAQKRPVTGVVLAVGSPDSDYVMPVEDGETVIFTEYAGHDIRCETEDGKGETVVLLSLKDVLAVVMTPEERAAKESGYVFSVDTAEGEDHSDSGTWVRPSLSGPTEAEEGKRS